MENTAIKSSNETNAAATMPEGSVQSCRALMTGWLKVEHPLPQTGLAKQTLDVWFPATATDWKDLGLRYWQGELVHLEQIPASHEAEVSMGAIDGNPCRYYFKRFLMRSCFDALKHVVRPSRARRTWLGNALAASHGLHVARTVCLIETRAHGLTTGSAIITEEVPEATPLRDLLSAENSSRRIAPLTRQKLAQQLGTEVARWHAAGIVHGDMRHGNILCREVNDQFTFTFVDNERTRAATALHERVRNLVQLNMIRGAALPLRDRILFWHAYRAALPESRQYTRKLLAEVVQWTRKRWAEKQWL
jgi:tRNA A-37 threonylcarbamoyl transferase component Bud32